MSHLPMLIFEEKVPVDFLCRERAKEAVYLVRVLNDVDVFVSQK